VLFRSDIYPLKSNDDTLDWDEKINIMYVYNVLPKVFINFV